ncbi:hypothetical protein HYH03_015402 [Edaphochlamys debaryana]|uniref:Fungal lipase-type domain-containing protein n=1 Tax=Edaphochlamys debaryana TaxID=47281 RepID=A0A835XU47_9CHLO|nr:hypothetical protein HYH03_015402 [Edaphochlamys debaryana]|eukprot:KAG2485959.1 hypothetical protein HYH03_015402 [Edaphochlamys debaryana]
MSGILYLHEHEGLRVSAVSSTCRWTGCYWGGCAANEAEVATSWCWYAYRERCCQIITYSTCRAYLPCTNDASKPHPIGGVLSSVGVLYAAASFDRPSNAYVAAILANYVYESTVGAGKNPSKAVYDANFRARVLSRLGGTNMTSIWGRYDMEVIVVETYNAIIIAFAGTESLSDGWNDVKSALSDPTTEFSPKTSVRIGSGFFDAYSANRDAVLSVVTPRVQATAKRLWMTGHSLGGAYAVLFAARAQRQGLYVSGVYTFGSPRTGDSKFASVYTNNLGGLGSRTYRYEHSLDPVTLAPGYYRDAPFAAPTHVGLARFVDSCSRRMLTEQQPETLGEEQASRLEAELEAAEAGARAADDAGAAAGAVSRRQLVLFHGLIDDYIYNILKCRMSANDRANAPSYAALLGFSN